MPPLVLSIPHSLGRAEARRRLQTGLEDLPRSGLVSVENEAWTENGMTFTVRALGQSVPGLLDVQEDAVRLEIELPGILQKLWAPLQSVLIGRARLLLEKR